MPTRLAKTIVVFMMLALHALAAAVYSGGPPPGPGEMGTGPFSLNEFPPLFLPERYWNPRHPQYVAIDRNAIPNPEVTASLRRAEAAMGTIFDRLTLPLVLEGEKKPKPLRYFEHLYKELSSIDK